tara:strand:+ start:1253 stop:2137 length:885 start_codon:yes stop_codon:yes gene_type:complete
MSAHSNLEGAEEGSLQKRSNGTASGGTGSGANERSGGASSSAKAKTKGDGGVKTWAPLLVIVSLQVLFITNFEFSASRLQRDLDQSQERVHSLQTRLAAVEHSALACYGKLNSTELRILHESRIINDETMELRSLTIREKAEQEEIRSAHETMLTLNASVIQTKISLRYEMEERMAAEKAAQASQSSVQVVKDQLQNANDELKNLREKFHRENAKTQRKLSKAEKKAKEEEKQRQKYMEGMINLQSKLGHTKSMLENAAISDAGGHQKKSAPKAEPTPDEEDEDEADDPLIPIS